MSAAVDAALGALVGAVGAGVGGLLVPRLALRLPSPYVEATPRASRTALVAAVAGALLGAAIGWDWPLVYLVPLVPVGALLALLDRATHLIPTVIVWPTFAATAVLATAGALLGGDAGVLPRGLAGAAITGAIFYALWWLHSAGMGFGDVRLSTVVGLALGLLGWPELVIGVYAGFVLFAVPAVGRAVVRRDRGVLRQPTPYGPAMLAGAVVGVLAGAYLASR